MMVAVAVVLTLDKMQVRRQSPSKSGRPCGSNSALASAITRPHCPDANSVRKASSNVCAKVASTAAKRRGAHFPERARDISKRSHHHSESETPPRQWPRCPKEKDRFGAAWSRIYDPFGCTTMPVADVGRPIVIFASGSPRTRGLYLIKEKSKARPEAKCNLVLSVSLRQHEC